MNIEQTVFENFRMLAFNQQREVLDFVEFLRYKNSQSKNSSQSSFENSLGIGADLNVSISAEEIDAMRDEMWQKFPRENFFNKDAEQ